MHFRHLGFICNLLLIPFILTAGDLPWGKDADLAFQEKPPVRKPPISAAAACGGMLIRFHQDVISPADGPRSHYIPSSSQYTYDAMMRYGFFKGWILGCDRLMRENDDPWVYPTILSPNEALLKWDPSP